MLAALQHPAVRILAHPRGRMTGSRAGVIANWDVVFEAAAQRGVAIEIDGDPARQDLDFTLGRQALAFGCLFALDSDAHTTGQLSYAETALAHARLAAIPADRIVNCWPLERLLAWLSDPSSSAVVERAARASAERAAVSGDFDHSIVESTAHRPWPMPRAPWLMTQSWHDLLFAHWRVDVSELRRAVPAAFDLDLFDGRPGWGSSRSA